MVLASMHRDRRALLESVGSEIGGTRVSKYTYRYDSVARRTSVVNEGGAFQADRLNTYGYNLRSELLSSLRYNGTDPDSLGTEVQDEHRAYTYDSIGNRQSYTMAYPSTSTTYQANPLNEYDRTWAPTEVFGYDADGNTTEVGLAAGDFNHDGDVDLADFGHFQDCFAGPNNPPAHSGCGDADFDDDGDVDLTDFGFFQGCFYGPNHPPACATAVRPTRYTWDAENRLTKVEPIFPQADDKRLTFAYDYMGRRVQKKVIPWDATNSVWLDDQPDADLRFVYDGWNVVMVLDGRDLDNDQQPDNTVVRKYTWGLDVSGTFQGAAGINGLLASEEPQTVGDPKRHWFVYDGNGNVGQLLKYVAGTTPTVTLAAHYEYDPYGAVIRADDVDSSGVVNVNPFRFSTKWLDNETGLVHYPRRPYLPRLGRWVNEDPIEDTGGLNLYAFVQNEPVRRVDSLGMFSSVIHAGLTSSAGASFAFKDSYLDNVIRADVATDILHFFDAGYHAQSAAFAGTVHGYLVNTVDNKCANVFEVLKALEDMGITLHILQDFYSHTDWCEGTDMNKLYDHYKDNRASAHPPQGYATLVLPDDPHPPGAFSSPAGVDYYDGGYIPGWPDAHNRYAADDYGSGRDADWPRGLTRNGDHVAFRHANVGAYDMTASFLTWAKAHMSRCCRLKIFKKQGAAN
jgi:RHS repeat-associated protein